MKKIFILIVLFIYGHTASSQILIAVLFGDKLNTDKMEFGLMVSPTISNLTNIDSKPRPGLGLSLYFNIKLNQNLFFHLEASPKAVFGIRGITPYSTGNASVDEIFLNDENATVQRKIKTMSLPLMMRYRIKGLFFAELGPQVDLMYQTKDVFKTKIDDNTIDYTVKLKDQVAKLDVGLSAGLEYKLKKDKGMGISLRCYYGFTDVMTKIEGSQKNTAWYLNISIPIGAAPPK